MDAYDGKEIGSAVHCGFLIDSYAMKEPVVLEFLRKGSWFEEIWM